MRFNSLTPGRCSYNLKSIIFKFKSRIDISSTSCEIALRFMPEDITDIWWTLVQVMAWCCQVTSHYLSQCYLTSLSPYGVTMPQWVNTLRPEQNDYKVKIQTMNTRNLWQQFMCNFVLALPLLISCNVQVQVQVQQSLLSHMKYIQLINSIYIWCNNEGHWSISLFGPLLRYTFLISFHDNSVRKEKKGK